MGFKENILKKLAVDKLSKQIGSTIGTVESGLKIDRDSMRRLLAMSEFEKQNERDLELYVQPGSQGSDRVLVLDNDLGLYSTTVEDVVLRKSPTVKEMISIRNAIKILNDSDVLVSKKADTLEALQTEIVGALDLSFEASDLDGIINDMVSAMEKDLSEPVVEGVLIFSELLGYGPAPKAFSIARQQVWGRLSRKPDNQLLFGPLVLFSLDNNTLILYKKSLSDNDWELEDKLKKLAAGKMEAALTGKDVLTYLKQEVLSGSSQGS